MNDPYDLERLTAAQDTGASYRSALAELRRGRKNSHWMWFVFPQIAGFGASSMSRRYAISSLEEARRFLAHPVLGARLEECARILTELSDRSANDIFGPTDAMKLRSSMTLFARAAPENPLVSDVLDRYFAGLADEPTVARLAAFSPKRRDGRQSREGQSRGRLRLGLKTRRQRRRRHLRRHRVDCRCEWRIDPGGSASQASGV